MSLLPNDKIPNDISISDAYDKIQNWLKTNIHLYISLAEDNFKGSSNLINKLPSSRSLSEIEMRAVFEHVITNHLEWCFHNDDGHYKTAAYAVGALKYANLPYNLTVDERMHIKNKIVLSLY